MPAAAIANIGRIAAEQLPNVAPAVANDIAGIGVPAHCCGAVAFAVAAVGVPAERTVLVNGEDDIP